MRTFSTHRKPLTFEITEKWSFIFRKLSFQFVSVDLYFNGLLYQMLESLADCRFVWFTLLTNTIYQCWYCKKTCFTSTQNFVVACSIFSAGTTAVPGVCCFTKRWAYWKFLKQQVVRKFWVGKSGLKLDSVLLLQCNVFNGLHYFPFRFTSFISLISLVKNKYCTLKYIYLMLSILQIHLHLIYFVLENTLQLYTTNFVLNIL